VIYVADTAGLPYGTKTEAQIAARVSRHVGPHDRAAEAPAGVHCNTASTIALASVRDVLEVPIVGTVPAIKPAAAMTQTGVIGLLGTQATIRQAYVDRLEAEFAADKLLLRHGAPDLVAAAEARLRGRRWTRRSSHAPWRPARPAGGERIDTVVLACTHFPLLAGELGAAFGPGCVLSTDQPDRAADRLSDARPAL
jgi:glutamate racemase